MMRFTPALIWIVLLALSVTPVRAEDPGQEDLDKATQLQLNVQSLNDIERVINLCESALRKGLDGDNTAFARQLLVGAFWQRASELSSAIFDRPQPDPRWPAIRTLAIGDLEKLLEIDPKFGDAHLLIARLQGLPRGDAAAAMKAIDQAIKLFANEPRKKSEALLRRAGLRKSDEDRLADLNAAIDADPSNADAWQIRAAYHIGQGDLEKAVADFEKQLENDAGNVAVHQALAEALSNLERYDLAEQHLKKAIELAPEQSLNFTLRARIHEQQDELDKAITDLGKALELEPGNAFALLTRSRLYYLNDNLAAAREDVEQVLRSQPGSVQAILLRSMISAAERRFRDAITDLQMILEEDPNNAELLLQMAAFYMADERPRKAVTVLTKVIEADRGNWQAYRTRADALLSIGNHREAIADYEEALKLQPEDDGILNNLAWVLATSPKDELRNGRRAIQLATKACEVTEYARPHILSTLAAAFAETGDFETAIKWSNQAVEKGREELKDQLDQLQQELDSYKDGKPWRELQEIKDKLDPPRRVIET